MNKQDLLTQINATEMPEATKTQILSLLNSAEEITPEVMSEVQELIQDAIDEGMSELLSEDQKKEIAAIQEAGDAEIKATLTEMDEDVAFVESEMNELDEMAKSIVPILEEVQINEVKAGLDKATE